jgi:hypothetical protein
MRHVILPVLARISCRNKVLAEHLQIGDQVQAYDYRSSKLMMTTIIAVNPVDPVQKILTPINGWRIVALANETVALSPQGECTLSDKPRQFIGFCQKNPIKLLLRGVGPCLEYNEEWAAVELIWDGPQYIWAEGILVGNAKLD